MKSCFAFLGVVLFSLCLSAGLPCYYSGGKKIELIPAEKEVSFIPSSAFNPERAALKSSVIADVNGVLLFKGISKEKRGELEGKGRLLKAYRFRESDPPVFLDDTLFVKIPAEIESRGADEWFKRRGLHNLGKVERIEGTYRVRTSGDVLEKAKLLVESGEVSEAEPNIYFKVQYRAAEYTPDDAYYPNQWHLYSNSDGYDHAHVAEAWQYIMDKGRHPGKV